MDNEMTMSGCGKTGLGRLPSNNFMEPHIRKLPFAGDRGATAALRGLFAIPNESRASGCNRDDAARGGAFSFFDHPAATAVALPVLR